jgi:hypothetical protein
MIFTPLSIEKYVFARCFGATSVPYDLFYSTKSNLYLIFLPPLTWANLPYTYIHLTFQVPILMFIFLRLGRLSKESVKIRGSLWSFVTSLFFYGEELLAPRPTPKLEDHSLSAVRESLFNIFSATLCIWRLSLPSATWGRATPWWQGTHLTWNTWNTNINK